MSLLLLEHATMRNSKSSIGLRIVLVLAGLLIIVTGINVAFGGILTLGWQGANDFAVATNQQQFFAQDSHVRFLGGVWLSIGLLFVVSATNPIKFQAALRFALIATFIGGLARFGQMNLDVTLGQDVLGSLIAELVGMPLLYFWLSKIVAQSTPSKQEQA